MSNWIFGSKTTPDVFEKRISEEKWPIFKDTRNKMKLKKGDRIVFYKAGKDGHKFIGTARLGSEIIPDNMDFFVILEDIQIWKKPVEVPDILNELRNCYLCDCFLDLLISVGGSPTLLAKLRALE